MKTLSVTYSLLFLLISIFSCKIESTSGQYMDDCCQSSCYECACNPLYCGAWGVQFQAGVRPIKWRSHNNFSVVDSAINNDCVINNTVSTLADLPSFHRFFKLPWQVGFQLSYALSDNSNIFFEFNYAQANHKNDLENLVALNSISVTGASLSKYKIYEGYIGTRYYFDRWCDRTSFFIGGKIGALHHKHVHFTSSYTFNPIVPVSTVAIDNFLKKNTTFAGGAHAGLDICFCGNWSLVLTAEVIATCGPQGNTSILVNSTCGTSVCANNLPCQTDCLCPTAINNILIGGRATELAFPVTLGIKYNF